MPNPNILRYTRFASAVVLTVGALGCSGESSPTPPISSILTIDDRPVEKPPACTSITATPDAVTLHTMQIKLETTDNTVIPGVWSPDHAEYSFGDGLGNTNAPLTTTHTYPNAGTYTVNAAIVMDITNPSDTPFTDGMLNCPPMLIAVP